MISKEETIADLMTKLRQKDCNIACNSMRTLVLYSAKSAEVYPYFDEFIAMLSSKNALVRNRGLLLIAANARHDKEHKLNEAIDAYLYHLHDEKPITARQCLKGLTEIAAAQPQLRAKIKTAVEEADFSGYKDSMRPLLMKDAAAVLKAIDAYT